MGMFDSPDMVPLYQQQQDTQNAMNAANLPIGSGGVYAANIAGNMIGRGVAGAMGYQDPMMQHAQRMQAAMKDTESSGIDYTKDPVSYMSLASKNLFRYGLYDQGMQVADKVKEMAQGQLAQVQTQQQTLTLQHQQGADQTIANILKATNGDEVAAAKLMRVNANPLVQKRGEELDAKRYIPVPEYGLYDQRTGNTIGAQSGHTDLAKAQSYDDSLQSAMSEAKKNNAPQNYIDALQTKIDQSQDKLRLLTQGTPKTAMDERAMKRLMTQQLIADFGLNQDQANVALSGNINSLIASGMAPNKAQQIIAKTRQMQTETDQAILNQQHMIIDPVTQKPMYIQPLQVPPSITVGKAGATAGTNPSIPTNQVPSMEGGRRPLDGGTEKKFSDIGNGLQQIDLLKNGFKDDYGGFVSKTAGDLAIEMGRRGVTKWADTANFWQTYRQWGTDIRALKFGLTLTPAELKSFEGFTVNPSDSPDLIKKNIQKQEDLVNAAAQRELSGLNVSGQNVNQGEALSGVKMLTKGKMPTPTPPTDAPIVRPMNPNPSAGQPQYSVAPQTPSGAGGGNNTMTWEDGGYMYRQLPDGTVQRKKK